MSPDPGQVDLDRLAIAGDVALRVIGGGARHTFATDHGRLLVSKGDQLDAMPQANALVLKSTAGFKTCQDSKGTIKASTSGNGVEVRPGYQSRTMRIEAFKTSNQIARGIDTHLHAQLLHPAGQQIAAFNILRRKTTTADTPISLKTDAGHLFDRFNQPLTLRTRQDFAWLNSRCRSAESSW